MQEIKRSDFEVKFGTTRSPMPLHILSGGSLVHALLTEVYAMFSLEMSLEE